MELPLTHPEYYEEMGIKPPKGVILYGAPGTGKTLLAKAVANQTSATFLRVVGSELIQKYLGDGPKLVRELFRVAEEHAPSIGVCVCSTFMCVSFSSMIYRPLETTTHDNGMLNERQSLDQCS